MGWHSPKNASDAAVPLLKKFLRLSAFGDKEMVIEAVERIKRTWGK